MYNKHVENCIIAQVRNLEREHKNLKTSGVKNTASKMRNQAYEQTTQEKHEDPNMTRLGRNESVRSAFKKSLDWRREQREREQRHL